MIQVRINNEFLDIDQNVTVTFKKSQNLTGIQGQYSYSNNISLKPTSKNLRILGINYLPNSKAKSMTLGYDCDVILNGCIFLKKQKLKVQKEGKESISTYIIFTDSFFVSRSKEVLLNSIDFGFQYDRTLSNFLALNEPTTDISRTAPVSAQDESGIISVQEVPALLNIVEMMRKVIGQLSYFPYGDLFTDTQLVKYYTNPNAGIYIGDDIPLFDANETCFTFITKVLKTFNGFIEFSDSERSAGVFLWKNIETMKKNFVDYSNLYTGYEEYSFEGGLAKKNSLKYADSPPFYNSYFENNKSIVEKSDYLNSDFGAGSMRLFDDQDINDDNTINLRTLNELGETSTLNIYKFEETQKEVSIYDNGIKSVHMMYKAISPNMFELYEGFHYAYTKNISLPTVGVLSFRYDAVFISNFKMTEVFFVKDLSSYWLPLEENFTTQKDKVKIKALMIEKTAPDVPLVYDLNVVLNFLETKIIPDANDLYFASNTSPQATFIVREFDDAKNRIYVTGSDNVETEVLSVPYTVDVSTQFILKIEAISTVPVIENSDLLFQFISEEGGISRVGKINIQNRGRLHLVSDFNSVNNITYEWNEEGVNNFTKYVNKSQKIVSPVNIPDSLTISTSDTNILGTAIANFKAIDLVQNQNLKLTLNIGYLEMYLNKNQAGSSFLYPRRRLNVSFQLYKNGVLIHTMYTKGVSTSSITNPASATYSNASTIFYFNANANDDLAIFVKINGEDAALLGPNNMDYFVKLRNINWKFECFQQL